MIDLGQERLKLLLVPIRASQRLLLLVDHVKKPLEFGFGLAAGNPKQGIGCPYYDRNAKYCSYPRYDTTLALARFDLVHEVLEVLLSLGLG
jgi:hypothetical protein